MKTHTYESGGSNSIFCWAYIYRYMTNIRIIWVAGDGQFASNGRAVIDDFGNLVKVPA